MLVAGGISSQAQFSTSVVKGGSASSLPYKGVRMANTLLDIRSGPNLEVEQIEALLFRYHFC